MVVKHDLPQDNLARNLKYLMDRHGLNAPELAERLKGKVSKSTLHYILTKEKVAKIDTADHIARVFGLSGWNLISPTLIQDMDNSPTLSKLITDYQRADQDGRRHIEQVADREARYVDKSGR
jgi:transcriptional regulator with XRE-family HTH domain